MPPINIPESSNPEMHIICSRRDFLMSLWALWSFYRVAGPHYALFYHDDGSLTKEHKEKLHDVFPGAHFIPRKESDQKIKTQFVSFPRSLRLRNLRPLAMRLLDYSCYGNAQRLLFMDADILFYQNPEKLLVPSGHSRFVRDVWTNYDFSEAALQEYFGVVVPPSICAGLANVDRDILDIHYLEKCLGHDQLKEIPCFIDQTLLAVLAARKGVEVLGDDYKMTLEKGLGDYVYKHYTRLIRHLFYTEGISYLKTYANEV